MLKMRTVPTPAALAKAAAVALLGGVLLAAAPVHAQSTDPAAEPAPVPLRKIRPSDAYHPTETGPGLGTLNSSPNAPPSGTYANPYAGGVTAAPSGASDGYTPRYSEPVRPYGAQGAQAPAPSYNGGGGGSDDYRPPQGGSRYDVPPAVAANQGGYERPYDGPDRRYDERRADDRLDDRYDDRDRRYDDRGPRDGTYSPNDIIGAGSNFFGAASQGLAQMVETLFKRQGRPNGYILGEEGGGAFVAGLRYGEGRLYTRDAGSRKIFWQGPSVGYDFGGAGSKTMILVYNLRSVNEIYDRFGGIDGSAYFVGGLGMTLLSRDHITVAPIRAGIGLRLGANVGYLKFTPNATWNPF